MISQTQAKKTSFQLLISQQLNTCYLSSQAANHHSPSTGIPPVLAPQGLLTLAALSDPTTYCSSNLTPPSHPPHRCRASVPCGCTCAGPGCPCLHSGRRTADTGARRRSRGSPACAGPRRTSAGTSSDSRERHTGTRRPARKKGSRHSICMASETRANFANRAGSNPFPFQSPSMKFQWE